MTNFQKLKDGITVEQMAEFLSRSGCPREISGKDMLCGSKQYDDCCSVCWAMWLRREAEEEE